MSEQRKPTYGSNKMTWLVRYQLDGQWYTAQHDNGRDMAYSAMKSAANKAKSLWRDMRGQRNVAIVASDNKEFDGLHIGVENL